MKAPSEEVDTAKQRYAISYWWLTVAVLLPFSKYYRAQRLKIAIFADLDLCLEVVPRSCQSLRYIRRWLSRKPLERGLVPTDNQ